MSTTPTPAESSPELPPPPYTESDPDPSSTPEAAAPSGPEEAAPKTVQPPVTASASVRIQEKPSFPPPAYSETPIIITDDAESQRREEEGAQFQSAVSPLLWLVVIISILMFSPCGYLAFAFTCFAFWTETGGNVRAARYLSSVARICALAAFLMGLLILLGPHVTNGNREPYCLFEKEYYQICV